VKGTSARHRIAAQILVLCCAGWAFSFPAMKALALIGIRNVPESSSVFLATLCVACRFSVAAACLLPVVFSTASRFQSLEIQQGLGIGLFSALGLILQMDGMAYTSASTAAFLTQGYCVWIPIWFAVLHRKFPATALWISSLLVMAGAAILSGVTWTDFTLGRGEIENLAGSVLFAGQILWLERPQFTGTNVFHFSLVMFLTMAAVTWPLAFATAPKFSAVWHAYSSTDAMGIILFLVVVCTLITFLLANRWQPEVPATEAGLLYCTEPVFTCLVTLVVPGWISAQTGIDYPNEHLTRNVLVGGGLILTANIGLQLTSRSKGNSSLA
jgi:drug/metabolite transporter (DMT)-like permease